jgi:hypothetical protein
MWQLIGSPFTTIDLLTGGGFAALIRDLDRGGDVPGETA